ncbi:MAG: cation:proton antiporter [Verrucomicrobiales bacterium]|nr:cation:proton antiporter [Verrucomicrobiales bacterium]
MNLLRLVPGQLFLAADALPPLFILLAVMLVGLVLVSLLLIRLQQSLLVGYFLCGVLVANSGVLNWLGGETSQGALAQMSEFGVMLLMFTLGLEFSLGELKYLRRLAFGGGALQMGICGGIGGVLAVLTWGLGWQAAVVVAVALAMSSTAVSLKTYQDLGLGSSPGARFALAIAIFQDLFIIVFLLFLPLVLGQAEVAGAKLWTGLASLLGRGLVFGALSWVLGARVFPWLLHSVTRTRNQELFTLTVFGCCVGLAFAGGLLGLGMALGAFVAGLAVSESIYKHRILADVMPLKDLFLTLFFVSVGLMIDLKTASNHWQAIVILTLGLMLAKSIIITLIARGLGLAVRQTLLTGLGLCSAGEFSLVLLQKAAPALGWSADLQQTLLASVALSMGLLPATMRLAEPLSHALEKLGLGKKRPAIPEDASLRQRHDALKDHAIICGHGPVGEKLNKALLDAGVPTLVIELNADTVRTLRQQHQPVLFADAGHEETWALAKLESARLVAFTFPSAPVVLHGIELIRLVRPDVPVMVRARFASDVDRLKRLGATLVIQDESEASRAIVENALVLAGGPTAPTA